MTIRGKKFKIVFHRGKPLTRVVLIAMITLCTVAMVAILINITKEQARLEAGKAAAIAQEQENQDLKDKTDRLGSQEGILEIAGEELGLYNPDTIIVDTE